MNETENIMDEHIENFVNSQSYLPLVSNFNGGALYLKNYSTVVQSVGYTDFFDIPEHFMEREIPILENPTMEEKVILATSNLTFGSSSDYLTAIVKGRTLLETKSKEEAIDFCNEEIDRIITERIKSNDANYDVVSSKSKLATLMLSYLDGSLYEKSIGALELFQGASLSNEDEMVDNMEDEEEMEVDESEESLEEEEDASEDEMEQDSGEIDEDDDEIEEEPTLDEVDTENEEDLEQSEDDSVVVPDASVEATASQVQNVVSDEEGVLKQEELPSLEQAPLESVSQQPQATVDVPTAVEVPVPSVPSVETSAVPDVAVASVGKEKSAVQSTPLSETIVNIPSVASSSATPESINPVPSAMPEVNTTISAEAYNQMVNDVVNGDSTTEKLDVQGATELLNQPEVPVSPVPSVSIPLVQQATEVQAVAPQTQQIAPQPVMSTPVSLESMATEAPSFSEPLGGKTM